MQGGLAVMEQFPETISIFIRPSSFDELERRLRGRGTETETALQRRLGQAREEFAFAPRYRYEVVNDDLNQAVREIRTLLTQEWEKVHNA